MIIIIQHDKYTHYTVRIRQNKWYKTQFSFKFKTAGRGNYLNSNFLMNNRNNCSEIKESQYVNAEYEVKLSFIHSLLKGPGLKQRRIENL